MILWFSKTSKRQLIYQNHNKLTAKKARHVHDKASIIFLDANAPSAPAVNPTYKSGTSKLRWCFCRRKAHVVIVILSTGDASFRRTAEHDSFIAPSQERSREESIKKIIVKTMRKCSKPQIRRLPINLNGFKVMWGFISSALHYSLVTENNSLMVVHWLLSSDTEAGAGHMTAHVHRCSQLTVASRRPVRLSEVQLLRRSMWREQRVSAWS